MKTEISPLLTEHTFRETLQTIKSDTPEITSPLSDKDFMDKALEKVVVNLRHELTKENRNAQDEQIADNIRNELGLPTSTELAQQEIVKESDQDDSETNSKLINDLEGLSETVFKEDPENNNAEIASKNFSTRILSEIDKIKYHLSPSVQKTIEFLQKFEPELGQYFTQTIENAQGNELAQKLTLVFNKIKPYIPEDYYNEVVSQLSDKNESDENKKKSRLKMLSSVGFDFIPVVGPAKMLIETKVGKTFDGTKLEGLKRVLHGIEGGTFLLLDAVGVGIPLSKAAKGSEVGVKLFTRSAAVARNLGMSREVYGPVYRTGRLIADNPALTKLIDRTFEELILRRKTRLMNVIKNTN